MEPSGGESSKSSSRQDQQPESVPSPTSDPIDNDRDEILKSYVPYLQMLDESGVMKFIGEQEAIRQLANPSAQGEGQGHIRHGGLLMPQKRHSLKWDPSEFIPENCGLFNPETILAGSQRAWCEETMRVGMKMYQSTLRNSDAHPSDHLSDHSIEVLQAMAHVATIAVKSPENGTESEDIGRLERTCAENLNTVLS
ncbi:hypothetical protein FPOAC2_13026 [Fusarium poae]